MNQTDLFDGVPNPYALLPYDPYDTRAEAHKRIAPRAGRLQLAVINALHTLRAATADEVAAYLGESILSIRPRVTELKRLRVIVDTGERRTSGSGSGCKQKVFTPASLAVKKR